MKAWTKKRIKKSAFAFRGYNITNRGRSLELLVHPAYGPILERHLSDASAVCAEAIGRKVNLVSRVQRRAVSTMRNYPNDLAMIVAVEMAQLEMLEEFFDFRYADAQLSFGYSLGEIAAVIAGGVFDMQAVMTPILSLSRDAARLADDNTMAVLFSRGPELDMAKVEKLCLEITSEGRGTLAISCYLSPNTVLMMGQGDTIDAFKKAMNDVLTKPVHLRKNPHRWPPLHTPICRQKNIPDRAAVMLESTSGGFQSPQPPILSCVTGDYSYNDYNSREILDTWADHPQHVWDVIDKTLAAGIQTIIHVGPEPNILPATFNRLSNNVEAQLSKRSLASLGLRAVSRLARRRPWLSRLVSSDATLLRAPFVEHVILEDWLLEQDVTGTRGHGDAGTRRI